MAKYLIILIVILGIGEISNSPAIIKFSEEGDDVFSIPSVSIFLLVNSYSTLGRLNGYRSCIGPA